MDLPETITCEIYVHWNAHFGVTGHMVDLSDDRTVLLGTVRVEVPVPKDSNGIESKISELKRRRSKLEKSAWDRLDEIDRQISALRGSQCPV